MESVNIKKLAQLLGLSIATVSKALRDSYDISKETKEKVVTLARELNYQPNPHASSLRRHASKTIAVIIPEIANNYFTLVIDGIESVVQEKGYHVMIYLTHEDVNREIAFARTLHNGRVDGALISVSGTSNEFTHFRELQAKGLPMVFFDRVVEDFDTIKVTTDDFESAYLATKHLIERGCQRIAHLGISKNLSIGKKRLNGYMKALADHNMAADDTLIAACTNDNTKDFEIISNLFTEHKVDGIFASNQPTAIGMLRKLEQFKAQGTTVNASFVGFDSHEVLLAGVREGKVAALVVQDPKQMGYLGVKTMLRHLAGEKIEANVATAAATVTKENIDQPQIRIVTLQD